MSWIMRGGVCLLVLLEIPAQQLSAIEVPLTFDAAKELARASVFRLAGGDGELQKGHGSGVLLEIDKTRNLLTLATCAHVLADLQQPWLWHHVPEKGIVQVAKVTGAIIDVNQDAAILQATWTHADKSLLEKLKPIPMRDQADGMNAGPPAKNDSIQDQWAFAAGFAWYQSNQITVVDLRLGGLEDAAVLVPLSITRPYSPWPMRVATLSPTAQGMSGGLVLAQDGTFAGLVLGRVKQDAALLIPAKQIQNLHRQQAWKIWEKGPTWKALPYDKSVLEQLQKYRQQEVTELVDSRSWSDSTRLLQFFEDPGALRQSFQEVEIDSQRDFLPKEGTTVGEKLSLTLEPACYRGSKSDSVTVWINGHAILKDRPKDVETEHSIDASPYLVPGENLIILKKERQTVNPLLHEPLKPEQLIGGLAHDTDLSVVLRDANARTSYRIERSLPGLVEGYAVYITLRRALERSTSAAQMDIHLDWVESLLLARGMIWTQTFAEPHTGSIVDAEFSLFPMGAAGTGVKLTGANVANGQSLDVEFPARIKINRIRANVFGAQIRQEKEFTVDMTARGRFQWIEVPPKPGANEVRGLPTYAICARLVGGRAAEARFPLAIGDLNLNVDLAPIIQEIVFNYVNSTQFHPDKPRIVLPEAIQKFFLDAAILSNEQGRATLISALVDGRKVKLGFGAARNLPVANNADQPFISGGNTAIALRINDLALDGKRFREIAATSLPPRLRPFFDRSLGNISGIAELGRSPAIPWESVTVTNGDLTPLGESYRRLFQDQTQFRQVTFAMTFPRTLLEELLPVIADQKWKWNQLNVEGRGALGHEPMLARLKAGDLVATADSMDSRTEAEQFPVLSAKRPKITLSPIRIQPLMNGNLRINVSSSISAESLDLAIDAHRRYRYHNFEAKLEASVPGDNDADMVIKVVEAKGEDPSKEAFPLARIMGKCLIRKQGRWDVMKPQVP